MPHTYILLYFIYLLPRTKVNMQVYIQCDIDRRARNNQYVYSPIYQAFDFCHQWSIYDQYHDLTVLFLYPVNLVNM
jgi:hypothetical protein